eukprot:TRINITY_DN4652_c0_g1_i1.p1 TRINITY_DN4652_c0_g1~~TRINITY_DN4652_c0_g1_i1.p1  ORF type:complete len:255 (-),score=30.29 TRINITY_DN4652_c0_g1_i1:165-929(-)
MPPKVGNTSDSKQEQEQGKQKAANPSKSSPVPLDGRSDFWKVSLMTSSLCMVSGMVNVVAFYELGVLVSHHTGNTSHVGRQLGADSRAGLNIALVMVAFMAGSAVAGYCESDGDAFVEGRRSGALLGCSCIIVAGVMAHQALGMKLVATMLWSMSQGLQNGVTSRFSSMPLRTTHMTGSLTDVGLIFGQWASGKRLQSRKLAVLGISIISFGFGGLVARILKDRFGIMSALVPAIVLVIVAQARLNGDGKPKAA